MTLNKKVSKCSGNCIRLLH